MPKHITYEAHQINSNQLELAQKIFGDILWMEFSNGAGRVYGDQREFFGKFNHRT